MFFQLHRRRMAKGSSPRCRRSTAPPTGSSVTKTSRALRLLLRADPCHIKSSCFHNVAKTPLLTIAHRIQCLSSTSFYSTPYIVLIIYLLHFVVFRIGRLTWRQFKMEVVTMYVPDTLRSTEHGFLLVHYKNQGYNWLKFDKTTERRKQSNPRTRIGTLQEALLQGLQY
jgi:hypothetical protein